MRKQIRDVNGQTPPQKCDETLEEMEHDVNGQTPQKRDETHDEDGPPPDSGLKSQECDGTTAPDRQPDPIVITPDQVVTEHDSIIDLSGQILIDAKMGNAYNIDDVDVSQFIVNGTTDKPIAESSTSYSQTT